MREKTCYGIMAVIFLFACLYLFWDISRPFNETDEFWYAEIVKNMIHGGDLLIPHFAGSPDYNKPPLFFWLSMPAWYLFSNKIIALRILPGVCFLFLLVLVFKIVKKCTTSTTGLLASAIMLLTYDHLHNHGYRSGVMEGPLNLLIALAYWLNLELHRKPSRIVLLGVVSGLVFMTKTVFAVIPITITLIHLYRLGASGRPSLKWCAGGVAAFLCTVLPWFIAFYCKEGGEGFAYMFGDQVFGRFFNGNMADVDTRNFGRKEFLYPVWHLLTWGQPWSQLSILSVAALRSHWGFLSAGVRRAVWLALIWIGIILLTFLVSKNSYGWYFSSIYIPMSIVCAIFISYYLQGLDPLWNKAASVFCFGFLFVLPTAYRANPYSGSSGGDAIDSLAFVQLSVTCVLVVLVSSRYLETYLDFKHKRMNQGGGLLASAVILPLIIVVGSEKTWAIVSVWMIAFLCVLYGIYIFYLHFDEPRVRLFAISVPFLISAMLLLVPVIQYSGIDNRRKEVLWFESEAVQSSLISKSKVTLKNINRYSYVVLANSYSDMYTFDFEPANKKLTIYKKAEQGADK